MIEIFCAETDDEIQRCYRVMVELRAHLKEDEFLPLVRHLAKTTGFQLICLTDGEVKVVAGIRISEWLANGKYLEIEDFVTKSGERSKNYGGRLFDWLVEYARKNQCRQMRLVSHVTRFDAHRFYLNKRMNIEAHYFSINLID